MLTNATTYFRLPIFILGFLFLNVVQAQFTIPPKPSDSKQKFVYDYAELLSNSDKESLEYKLNRYADSTSTQVVVVIIETLKGESIGMLTPKWGHAWGIGQEAEDNGVIILLAEKERRIWISPGYGAENKLTAGIVGEITRNRIIPYFKRGNYYGGLDEGVNSIFEVLNGEFKNTRRPSGTSEGIPAGVVIFLIIFFIVLISILGNNKRNGGGGNHRGGRRSTGNDLLDIIILSNLGRGSFGSGSSGGGFGSGGGFSGGGGFGGGGFSGGGAGGSW